jgi:hypothetical protein
MILITAVVGLVAQLVAQPFPPRVPGGGWQWVPVEGSMCMDGSPTGVYVRYATVSSPSKSLAISFNGGGACFNAVSCATAATNPKPGPPSDGGIFNSTDERNPLRDYDFVVIPYCTGDVHIGQTTKKVGGALRHFHGRANLELALERATATFMSVETLVVTGQSAGGFGSATNWPFVRGKFPDARSVLVDDSGPILDDRAISPCLQTEWKQAWNLTASLPPGCPCIDGSLVSAWDYFPQLVPPTDSYGIISSLADGTISMFFSFGEAGCLSPVPLPYSKLDASLRSLAASGVPMFLVPGEDHVHTTGSRFYRSVVGADGDSHLLYEWVAQLISSTTPDPPSVIPSGSSVAAQ